MAAKEVEFLEEAGNEFKAAFDWYFERNSLVASEFADELIRAVHKVVEAPQRWPAHVAGTRKFLLHRFPFVIVYREFPSKVQIVAIAHARRRPGYWLSRL
jgi:toxin ParE1/3/4